MADLKFARYLFAFELFIGAQARLTNWTPSIRAKAYAKAEGYARYLYFIPSQSPRQHTQIIGVLMLLSGVLLIPDGKSTITAGATLGGTLALMGAYSQYRMKIPFGFRYSIVHWDRTFFTGPSKVNYVVNLFTLS